MKTWKRVTQKDGQACGSCRSVVPQGGAFLEIEIVEIGTKRARCAVCAKLVFDEDPPADIPDSTRPVVPAPTLPIDELYRHEHGTVSARELSTRARSRAHQQKREAAATANDFKSRQSGDR